MAWQLIYTSAPRLLEAGRSGFGTVARHRAISPLLVSALERASQFSRLPGLDADRVIFSYRIVTVAGGRFHVLTSIRDAGADYTGRTNHLAHHLIADPREIAQLGARGPSPADILLAQHWTSSWTESPRYLDATEEIAIAAFRPHNPGSGWERIAGNPNHAWLLASGDASRGAYVIQPPGVDLRKLFAESLSLMPERLWQISFITSLQQSDEPADFRWIGIEEKSPLRAQTETTGRPILDLTSPGTLPGVELPAPVATDPSRNGDSRLPPPSYAALPSVAHAEIAPAASDRPVLHLRGKTSVLPKKRSPSSRRSRNWLRLAAALTVCAAIGAGADLFLKPVLERRSARATVVARLEMGDYFSQETCRQMAEKLVPSVDSTAGESIADSVNRLAKTLHDASMTRLESPETAADLAALAQLDRQDLPRELGRLRDNVESARRLAAAPADLDQARDATTLAQIMAAQRSEISKLAAQPSLAELSRELYAIADRQQASSLLAMLNGRLPPPEGSAFERSVIGFAAGISDKEALATIDRIKRLLHEKHDPAGAAPKPETAPIQSGTAKEKPITVAQIVPRLSQTPLYFVNGKESLSNFRIEELRPNLKYFLKPSFGEDSRELSDFNNTGNLRRSTGASDATLVVDLTQKLIRPGKGGADLSQPFQISAKEAGGSEVFQIWIGSASGPPIFPFSVNGVTRKGSSLEFNPAAVGFSGRPKNPLLIGLPESCSPTSAGSGLRPLVNWSIDLSEVRKEGEALQKQWSLQLAEEQKRTAEPQKDAPSLFGAISKQLEQISRFDKDEKEKLLDPKLSPPERCGGYLQAVSLQMKTGGDPIFKAGADLISLKAGSEGKKAEEVVKAANKAVQEALRDLTTNEEKKALEARLRLLQQMLALTQPETKEAKAARLADDAACKQRIEALKVKLAAVRALGQETAPPPGVYRLFAKDGGENIPVVEIHVSQPLE